MMRLAVGSTVVALLALATACSDDATETGDGGSPGVGGMGASEAAGGAGGTGGEATGGGATGGGASTGGAGGSGGLPSTCDATCQALDASIDFGNGERLIERAFYGFTVSNGEPPQMYLELSRGGGDTCPTMMSPTPERLVLLHNIPIPESVTPLTDASGITGQYFDFVGDDLPNAIQTPALTISLTPRALDVCPECLGMPTPIDPNGFIALDVDVSFDGGSASGKVYATHCDSLDTSD